MSIIEQITALEVLDSRGNPTIQVQVDCEQASGTFTVPSGASTGTHEAIERRDGEKRYGGMGVRETITAIRETLAPAIIGQSVLEQEEIDKTLTALDGTETLGRLGANAILGVSGGVLVAASAASDLPLYEYIAETWDREPRLPMPMVNILSGGLHARGGMEVQDILVIPIGSRAYGQALEIVWNVRKSVYQMIRERGYRPLLADEGGFSPPLATNADAFELVIAGIENAGYTPGADIVLALDIAATHFYDATAETYALGSTNELLSGREFADRICEWSEAYPIRSIEDPLAEDDWEHWQYLASGLPNGIQLIGDDLVVTNKDRLARARELDAVNAVLVKPNQAGTMTRTFSLVEHAREWNIPTVISARSGETCDATIADLATGLDAGQIKIGSLARSERLAKYNRLLQIEAGGIDAFARFSQV